MPGPSAVIGAAGIEPIGGPNVVQVGSDFLRVQRVPAAVLRGFCEQVFRAVGVPPDGAALVADALVDADLRGHGTHGVARVPMYVERIRAGGIKAAPQIRVVRREGATAVVDADAALGQLAGAHAMGWATELAKGTGVGLVGVANSSRLGALGYIAMRAVPHDMIGVVCTNTGPLMAPWGGVDPVIGNNPVAVAVPTAGPFPIVFDTALSVTARGNILMASRRGEPIPQGWAIDRQGRPTTDPNEALLGSVLPVAGYKGYGMALILEILTGVLAGNRFGTLVGDMASTDPARHLGMAHLVAAIRIDAFLPVHEFKARLGELIEQVKGSRRREGVPAIFLPGERSYRERERRLREGIPLDVGLLDALKSLGQELRVGGLTW